MDLFGVLGICGCGYGWVPVEHVSLTVSGFPELSPLRGLSRRLPSPELGNRQPLLVTVTSRFQNPNSIIAVPI
jgi:hypothetical protein